MAPRSRPSSRKRRKKPAPVGLIVGLCLGGVALLGAVVAVIVLSGNHDAETYSADSENSSPEADESVLGLAGNPGRPIEPKPFHDEGLHQVGPLVREEIKLSNARLLGFAKTENGLPFVSWRLDYEFVNGGFQPASLRNAYELRVRGNRLEKGNVPQERAWTIRHPGNQTVYSEREAGVQMLDARGTVEVTWAIPEEDFAPPYTFWVYRKDPQSDEFFQRVSRYTSDEAPPKD